MTTALALPRCICGVKEGEYHRPLCPRLIAHNVERRMPYCVECGYSGFCCWLGDECLGKDLVA